MSRALERFLADHVRSALAREALRAAATAALELARARVNDARAAGCTHPHALVLWRSARGAALGVCPACARLLTRRARHGPPPESTPRRPPF